MSGGRKGKGASARIKRHDSLSTTKGRGGEIP